MSAFRVIVFFPKGLSWEKDDSLISITCEGNTFSLEASHVVLIKERWVIYEIGDSGDETSLLQTIKKLGEKIAIKTSASAIIFFPLTEDKPREWFPRWDWSR